MKDAKKLIKIFVGYHKSPKSRIWDKGNDVLYRLCREHPDHKDVGWILAKLWLIGRSYSAAIERTKHKKESSDRFCVDAAKRIRTRCRRFGEIIGSIPKSDRLSEDAIEIVLKAHSDLTDEFQAITGQRNKSLASKYLHFHRRIVPLYDSRARKGIAKIFREYKFPKEYQPILNLKSQYSGKDGGYWRFLVKILCLQQFLLKNKRRCYNMRSLDKYLIKVQDGGR